MDKVDRNKDTKTLYDTIDKLIERQDKLLERIDNLEKIMRDKE